MIRTVKDIARHILHKLGHERRFSYLGGSRQQNFSAIYEQKIWTHGSDKVPLSGHGSSLQATAGFREALPGLIDEIGAKTLLDLGCGDFTWMQHVDLKCNYIGIDIVPSVIEKNRIEFGSPGRRFQVMDFVEEVPPQADLSLCREVLFHLSLGDALEGIRNILRAGCSYFLITSDSNTMFNPDIQSGDFRALNLEKRPFCLPTPRLRIEDDEIFKGRAMCLWHADEIRKAIT